VLTVEPIFDLANKAHFLYFTRNSLERAQLLKSVLLNCATEGVSVSPTYRKPFDLIFQRAKNEEWSGREDLNPPTPWSRTRFRRLLKSIENLEFLTVFDCKHLVECE
jgi:hypothetical protein